MAEKQKYIWYHEFIEIFSDPEAHKEEIESYRNDENEIVLISEDIVGYFNHVIEGQELEALKKAQKNAHELGFSCKFNDGFSIDQALKASARLQGWIDQIQSAKKPNGKPLSPFEKFIYAMEICTEFYYSEEDKDSNPALSRDINYILTGDKIVCMGYANLMETILQACGVTCTTVWLVPTSEKQSGHAACILYMQDPEYGIDGFFLAEPTGAARRKDKNGAKRGFFQFAFLTPDLAEKLYAQNSLRITLEELGIVKEKALEIAEPELVKLKDKYEMQQLELQEIADAVEAALQEARAKVPAIIREKTDVDAYFLDAAIMAYRLKDIDGMVRELQKCCEVFSNQEILEAFDKEISEERGLRSAETAQAKERFDRLMAKDIKRPIERYPMRTAICNVARARGMSDSRAFAHTMALEREYDPKKEEFFARYIEEHGLSKETAEEATRIIAEMEEDPDRD